MNEELEKCPECNETFSWDDDVIVVDDGYYHKECVNVIPCGYFAMTISGDPIGETENDEGSMAYEVLSDGEYLEEGKE